MLYGDGGLPDESYQATNYWVDPVLSVVPPVDNTAPAIVGIGPTPGSTDVPVESRATVYFTESLDVASVNANNVVLQGPGGVTVATTLHYYEDSGVKRVTLTPLSALASSTGYTIFVRGGASGIKDIAGNALIADATYTFTTAAPGFPVYSAVCRKLDAARDR